MTSDALAGGMIGSIWPTGRQVDAARLIAGVKRLQGAVTVIGGDVRSNAHRDALAQRIAYACRRPAHLFDLSVAENVDFFRAANNPDAAGAMRCSRRPAAFADRAAGLGGMKRTGSAAR